MGRRSEITEWRVENAGGPMCPDGDGQARDGTRYFTSAQLNKNY
ncbi:MAG: hypothetical protein AAF998_09165 [Bacteroidota bacterium]